MRLGGTRLSGGSQSLVMLHRVCGPAAPGHEAGFGVRNAPLVCVAALLVFCVAGCRSPAKGSSQGEQWQWLTEVRYATQLVCERELSGAVEPARLAQMIETVWATWPEMVREEGLCEWSGPGWTLTADLKGFFGEIYWPGERRPPAGWAGVRRVRLFLWGDDPEDHWAGGREVEVFVDRKQEREYDQTGAIHREETLYGLTALARGVGECQPYGPDCP